MILYLLENCLTKKYYIGVTSNIEERIKKHNTHNSSYTGSQPGYWKLIAIKEIDKSEALTEESRLKRSKNKKYILWYFTNNGC
jgi:putative endonuclease